MDSNFRYILFFMVLTSVCSCVSTKIHWENKSAIWLNENDTLLFLKTDILENPENSGHLVEEFAARKNVKVVSAYKDDIQFDFFSCKPDSIFSKTCLSYLKEKYQVRYLLVADQTRFSAKPFSIDVSSANSGQLPEYKNTTYSDLEFTLVDLQTGIEQTSFETKTKSKGFGMSGKQNGIDKNINPLPDSYAISRGFRKGVKVIFKEIVKIKR